MKQWLMLQKIVALKTINRKTLQKELIEMKEMNERKERKGRNKIKERNERKERKARKEAGHLQDSRMCREAAGLHLGEQEVLEMQ